MRQRWRTSASRCVFSATIPDFECGTVGAGAARGVRRALPTSARDDGGGLPPAPGSQVQVECPPGFLRPIGPPCKFTRASCVRLVHRENIPAISASGWFTVRTCPRFLRPFGSSIRDAFLPSALSGVQVVVANAHNDSGAPGGGGGGAQVRVERPQLPAHDWSAVRIYLRFLRLTGPS
eukprot:1654638-Pyramimonas_sp.AAC.1